MAICYRMTDGLSGGREPCFVRSPPYAKDGQPSPWQIGFQTGRHADHGADHLVPHLCHHHHHGDRAVRARPPDLRDGAFQRERAIRIPRAPRTTRRSRLPGPSYRSSILVAIAIPSFRLLFAQYDFPKADLTITATGSQWYWTYEYPDHGITFDSIMVQEADLKEGQPRLLTVDREVVVPVSKNVHGQVKSNDVIHDWAMPSFGVKLDAVPGRLQTTWFRAEREGIYSTASAPNYAAATMPSCRSPFAWFRRRSSTIGSPRPSKRLRRPTPIRSLRPKIREQPLSRIRG